MKHINEAYEYIMLLNNGNDIDSKSYLRNYSNSDQIEIMMSAKKLLVYAAISRGENMQSACYECKHRCSIPGDTHSGCRNPFAFAVGDEHGINHGWFLHPFNFDPVWLKFCDGFEEKIK